MTVAQVKAARRKAKLRNKNKRRVTIKEAFAANEKKAKGSKK